MSAVMDDSARVIDRLVPWDRGDGTRLAPDMCVDELIETRVAVDPDATAVTYGDTTLSFGRLNRRANQLAHELRHRGAGPGAIVGVCLPRTPDLVVALLAVLKSGAAYVPFDPGTPPQRLEFMLADTAATIVVTTAELAGDLGTDAVQALRVDTDAAQIAGRPTGNPRRLTGPSDLAYVIYTSGSTGTPKGVLVEHRGLVNFLQWCVDAYAYRGTTGAPLFSSVAFDMIVPDLYTPLVLGQSVCIVPDHVEANELGTYLAERGPFGFIKLTPGHLDLLAQQCTPAQARQLAEVLVVGADAFPASLLRLWRDIDPDTELLNEYGPTEASVANCVYRIDGPVDTDIVPVGRPIPDTTMYVLDESLNPVPTGATGELYIGGTCVVRGYLNLPALTAERFLPDPFVAPPGARMYRTGDLGRRMPDGNLEFLRRVDHQLKIRGYRIEPEEIEGQLALHDGVRHAVVSAVGDDETSRRLVAYVVPVAATDGAPAPNELRDFLAARLPGYMIPTQFVPLAALPLDHNGKLDRKQLPASPTQRAPERDDLPHSDTEREIAAIWCEVLGIDQVGVHDDFFALGGHSLLATRIVSRIRRRLGVDVPLQSIFDTPTIAGTAAALGCDGARPAGPPIRRTARPDGRAVPSFAQQRLWFMDRLSGGGLEYNVTLGWRLRGALDRSALGRAITVVMARHEALRTRFGEVDDEPVQIIDPPAAVPLGHTDVSDRPEPEDRAAEAARAAASIPFDLATGPLLRAHLVRVYVNDHLLLLTTHQIVSDAWSAEVITSEISELYAAFVEDRVPMLADLYVQYPDFAAWQRQWLTGAALDSQRRYWRTELAGLQPLDLPTDRPRPAVRGTSGGHHQFLLPPELTERLRELSTRTGASLFMTLLATVQVLYFRYTGQTDIAVGTFVAGRTRGELENLVGFFLNTLVLRGDLSADPTFVQLLGQLRERSLAAYENQDLPFEQLVEELRPERDLSRTPLVQVVFDTKSAPAALDLPGIESQEYFLPTPGAKFDLAWSMVETPQGLAGRITYSAELFELATIERMTGHFRQLLERVVADPWQHLSALSPAADAPPGLSG